MIARGARPHNSQSEKFQCHDMVRMRNRTVVETRESLTFVVARCHHRSVCRYGDHSERGRITRVNKIFMRW